MTDRDIITNLLCLYGLGVDTQRWDLFDEIFTEDVVADYGSASCWTNLGDFKRDFAAFHAPFDATQHGMSSVILDVDGHEARSVTYGSWLLVRQAVKSGSPEWRGQGWYDDCWVRGPVGWRISHRVCKCVSWGGNPMVQETIPGVKFELITSALRADADHGRLNFLAKHQSGRMPS